MNAPYFTAGLLSRHDTETGLFYDPRLFQGLLYRGGIETPANRDVHDGIWRDGENLYYRLEQMEFGRGAMVFTAHSGKYYANLSI